MNKQQFGNFIAENRKAAGLTQKDLAAQVHVTDKAVSKWERALSYPDVTLLEPLAEALGLGVEELMACRRMKVSEEKKEEVENMREEQPVRNLMELSRENMRSERRKHILQTALALALMLAATLGAIWYSSTYISDETESHIVLKDTEGEKNYLYVEDQGHLLRLKCGEGVDFDSIQPKNEWGEENIYKLNRRWNRRTYEGTVSACEFYGSSLGGMMDVQYEVESDQLFWYDEVFYTSEKYYPDPYGEPRGQVFLCDYRFWSGEWDSKEEDRVTVLLVEDCLNATVADVDGDGQNEVVARTRWPEKPYMVYDWCGDSQYKEIDQYWLESVSPELEERLLTVAEWQEKTSRELREALEREGDAAI